MQLINTIAIALATLATVSHGHRGHTHRFTHHRLHPRFGNETDSMTSSTSSLVDAALSTTSSMLSSSSMPSSSSSIISILGTGIVDAATTDSSPMALMQPSFSSPVSPSVSSSSSSDSALPKYSSSMNSPSLTSALAVDTSTMTRTTSTSISTFVSAATLTFTQGIGSTATVITTTIHMTRSFTITNTIYMHSATAAAAGNSAAPAGNTAAPAGNTAAPANFAAGASSLPITSAAPANLAATPMASNEPTTTLTTTSTSTRTVTVDLVSTNGGHEAAATNVAGMGGACEIVTFTTVLQSTIYVTASPSTAAAPAMSSQSVSVPVADIQSSIIAILAQVSSITNPSPSMASSTMASALPASFFDQGNSTEAANSTKHKLAGTGFMTLSSGSAMPTGYKL